jgi:murein DD-endopeptidase MepM/ murein hydrolase activator NlpD
VNIDRSGWHWPLPPKWHTITQAWDHVYPGLGRHAGVDVALTKLLVPVYAMSDGTIVEFHDLDDGPAGRWLLVAADDAGVFYNVQHLDRFYGGLTAGDRVRCGQVLAWTGDTGRETGLNAHIGVAVEPTLGSYADNSATVDPLLFVTCPPVG